MTTKPLSGDGMNEHEPHDPIEIGAYVLATKYDDGDPCDHFYVGFVSGYTHHGRYLIVDSDGQNQRANGFRRAETISDDEGRQLVALMPSIGDKQGPSVWWHLNSIRKLDDAQFCDACRYERGMCRCDESP